MNQVMLNSFLLQSLLAFLLVTAIVGVLVGAGMLLKQEQMMRLNQYLSRWTNTDKFGEQLDRPRWSERFFYRHHQLVGGGLFFGAIIILYTFLFSYNLRKVSPFITPGYWWLLDALVGLLLIGSVLAAIVGFVMLTKPSLLRELENSANRWVSTDHLLKWFNAMHYSAEQNILQHRRLVGTGLIFCSLYILGAMGYFLFRSG